MSQPILIRYKSSASNNGKKNFIKQDSSKLSFMQQTLSPIQNSQDTHKFGNTNTNSNQQNNSSQNNNLIHKKHASLLPILQDNCDEDANIQSQALRSPEVREGFLKIKLKSIIQKMVRYTSSRMYKNLTYSQLKMIDDKAYDSQEYLGQKSGNMRKSYNNDQRVFQNKGFLRSIVQKLDSIIPVLHPRHKIKTISDLMSLLAIVYLFYILSITICFHLVIDDVVPSISIYICLGFLFLNAFIRLNTGQQKLGNTYYDRTFIFYTYFKNNLYTDLIGFISILILLILDKDGFSLANKYPDLYSYLKVIFFIPFLLKFKDFTQLIQQFEEKVMFKQKMQHIVQIIRLFSIIILINHIMACVWIFNTKVTANQNINWIVAKNATDEGWFYQYVMAFYFCTVTMTSVGYGDITAKNLSEYIIAILIMLTSSGVFGFTLNQIGTIFNDFYSEDKEKKKKLNILNLHMEKKNVNHTLRSQIREYLEYVWQENNEKFTNDSAAILSQLNEDLKKELYLHQNRRIINYLEQHYSHEFIQKAILLIQEHKYKPHQKIESTSEDLSLYLIEKGQVELYFSPNTNQYSSKAIQVLEEGQMFGISEFYSGESRNINAKAIGFVNLVKITRNDFLKALQEFPRDIEMFNYLKDRRILNKDFSKIGEICISCGSKEHVVSNCNYIHFVPYRQKVITRYNYELPYENMRKKSWHDDKLEIKQRRYNRSRIEIIKEDDQRYELFAYEFYMVLEDYEHEHLSFNFNFNYTIPFRQYSDDDDDDQADNQQNNDNNISILIQSGSYNTQQQNYHQSNFRDTSNSIINYNNNTPINSQQLQEQHRLSTFDKVPSINADTAVNTPPIFNANISNNYNSNLNPGYDISPTAIEKRRKSVLKSLTPLIITSQASTQIQDGALITDSKPTRHLYTRNSKKLYPNPQQMSVNGSSHSSTRDINLHNLQQIQQMQQSRSQTPSNSKDYHNTTDSMDKQKSIDLQRQRSNNEHLQSQNSLKASSTNQQFSIQLKQFQRSIMKNIQTMIRTTNVQSTITKTNISEEQNDRLGMLQIFQSFDKLKDFQIYFPLNNLSFILFNLKNKKQITRNQYLQLIQNTTTRSKNLISSYTSLMKGKMDMKAGSKKEQNIKKAFTLKHLSFHSGLHNTPSIDNQSQMKEMGHTNKNQQQQSQAQNVGSNFNPNNTNNKTGFSYRNIHLPDTFGHQMLSERQIQTARSPSHYSKNAQLDLMPNKTEISISDSDCLKNFSLQSPNIQDEMSENNLSSHKNYVQNLQTGKNSEYFIKD